MGLRDQLEALNRDPYLFLADPEARLISVFDDLRYDRADMDLMAPGMRAHAGKRLSCFGFRQVSGNVFANRATGERCLIPKFRALGETPFGVTRGLRRGDGDFFLLTPTQTACHLIDAYPLEGAVARLEQLVVRHPINLLRIMDYLERRPEHRAFRDALWHLQQMQKDAISAEPLCRRRVLG